MAKRLKRSFYTKPTLEVAEEILGKYLVRKYRGKEIKGKIIEVEAYLGPKDKASHAFSGKVTSRNKAAFYKGGFVYIYLVYGMYWQFNISTFKEGVPECILIRALDILREDISVASGPGKLCRYLKLDKTFYGEDLVLSDKIWLEEGKKPSNIIKTARIGIDYAGPYWARRKLRFLDKDYKKYLK